LVDALKVGLIVSVVFRPRLSMSGWRRRPKAVFRRCPFTRPSTRWPRPQYRTHNGRNELRRLSCARYRLARLPAPGEHLLWRQPIPASDFRNNRTRNKRLSNDPGFEIRRELAPPPGPRKYLQPAHRHGLRLKRMVKRRHKPIFDSEDRTIAHRQTQMKVGSPHRLRLIHQIDGMTRAPDPTWFARLAAAAKS